MNKLLLALLSLAGIAVGLIFAYKEMNKERAREEEAEKPVATPLRIQRGTDGENVLKFDATTQKRIALQTVTLAMSKLDWEVKAYGRVLDPAPLAVLVSEINTAQAVLAASKNEFARLKALRDQSQNASVRALEAAEAAMKRDQIALDTAHDKLMLAWGKSMAEQLDLPALARSLTAQENLLVRLELPVGEALKEPPATARLLSLANNTTPVEASFFSLPTTADPQSQGQGFIFLVKGNALRLAPGAAVLGWLKAPGDPLAGVTVPRSAVVRALGQTWVYVQTGDDTFARRPIALEHPVESGWLVTAGLQPGERIVTAAAQVLLSEELKSQIKLLE